MSVVSMKSLLEAGVHFGHQTRRWNPRMKQYIFTERNGIHIIDLQKTVNGLERAYNYTRDVAASGEKLLFVGTKKQAQEAVRDEAQRSGQYYVNQRWLGGLLTNFKTIQERLRRLDELERMKLTGEMELRPKKEQLRLGDEMAKLNRLLGGIRTMRRLPAALFIVDCQKEHLAVKEASRLNIPIVALVDTNANPEPISYPIPANDDAIRAVRLIAERIADSIIEGQQMRESMLAEEADEAADDEVATGLDESLQGLSGQVDGEGDVEFAGDVELETPVETVSLDAQMESSASEEADALAEV
jgi:small subunit ribosomal protein S2